MIIFEVSFVAMYVDLVKIKRDKIKIENDPNKYMQLIRKNMNDL